MNDVKQKHSVLGIVSSGLGALAILSFGTAIIGTIIYAINSNKDLDTIDENSPIAILLGLFVIGSGILALIGFILGVVGAISKDKKIFPIVGIILNSLFLLIVVAIILLGLISD